ncbi:hypothetical protein AMATHDRAFT_6485 [Amanita thiersii Skay4041]|uniref:G-protein coupled receptors family 1 profile domain-containing protein n=1 Tax=Amanita thiersii Skay4041 TaxID=703135 RepID=A0A2A9NHF7_9AGAR|nr:hypothetical protein AMATHDRAFT_6485 [Amanita thiersii Skay4041]
MHSSSYPDDLFPSMLNSSSVELLSGSILNVILPSDTDAIELLIISTIMQAFFYGLYFASFLLSMRWLLFDDREFKIRKPIKWPLVITCATLNLLLALDFTFSLDLILAYYRGDDTPAISNAVVVVADCLIILITDVVLIYRCWVVYSRQWHIIYFPLGLWLCDIGCMAAFVYWSIGLIIGSITSSEIYQTVFFISLTVYICTILINVYATSVIIVRIRKVARQTNNSTSGGTLHFVIRIVAESGFLFTLMTGLVLISLILSRVWPESANFQVVLSAVNFPVIGIAFNLILIRTSQQRSNSEPDKKQVSSIHFQERNTDVMSRIYDGYGESNLEDLEIKKVLVP